MLFSRDTGKWNIDPLTADITNTPFLVLFIMVAACTYIRFPYQLCTNYKLVYWRCKRALEIKFQSVCITKMDKNFR